MEVRTARLVLTPVAASDLPELHALHADPRVWTHLPSGRHTTEQLTAEMIARMATGWRRNGLDDWTVRDSDGALVGIGGADLRRGAGWNLYYRLVPETQGRGYAQEVVAAARKRAYALRPDLPMIAFLLAHNEGSRRAAERAGLALRWRGRDAGNPDPAAERLVYADRPLGPEALAAFIG